MLIYLQSDLKKCIRLSLIMNLANDSIGSSECRDSTNTSTSIRIRRIQISYAHCILFHICLNKSNFYIFPYSCSFSFLHHVFLIILFISAKEVLYS